MDKIQELAITAAINKMLKDGYVSICVIDKAIAMKRCVPDRRAYEILSTLHCVSFKDMPKELMNQIPDLIKDCLSMRQFTFEYEKEVITVESSFRRAMKVLTCAKD